MATAVSVRSNEKFAVTDFQFTYCQFLGLAASVCRHSVSVTFRGRVILSSVTDTEIAYYNCNVVLSLLRLSA